MNIRPLTDEERERSDFDLLTDHVVIFRDGGNALVLDEDGTPREGPVSRDGSVIPNRREFPPVPEPDEAVEEAAEKLRTEV